jgi:hypothetical protein
MRAAPRLASALVSAVALASVVALGARLARADDTPTEIFATGAKALARGEYAVAIENFEALADQGFVHPDASYDRGLAYVMRYRAHAERPGDLGRAAAAFEEALLLRPGDNDADVALDLVRAEVTKKRARKSRDAVDVRPTLDRVVVSLADEQTWGFGALAASILLAVGLVLWARPGRAHVVGSVLAPIAGVALLILAPLSWAARSLRLATRPGVVITSDVRLVDEQGKPIPGVGDEVPEAASVEVGERRDALVRVRWGAAEGWIPAVSVRLLGEP